MARSRVRGNTLGDAVVIGLEISAESLRRALDNLQRMMVSFSRDISRSLTSMFNTGARSGAQAFSSLTRMASSMSRDLSRGLVGAFNAGSRAANSFGQVAREAMRSSERLTRSVMGGGGGGGFGIGGAIRMGTGIGAGMYAFDKIKDAMLSIPKAFWSAVNDASEAEVIERKFKSVFDNLTPQARKFAQDFASELGRSETEVKNFMNRFQDTLVPIGFGRERSMKLTETMTRLTADLAASEGISEAETADRIVSGLVGNHEALRRFGVIITETSLNSKLLAMGIKGGMKNATELEKVLGRLNMVLAGTRDAQGMAGRAAGSFATESRALAGVWTDLSATLGKLFLPSMARLTAFFREFAAKAKSSLGDTATIGERLGESFGKLLELAKPMGDAFVSAVEKIGKGFEWLAGAAEKFFGSDWNTIADQLNATWKGAMEFVYTALRDAIKNGIKDGLLALKNASFQDIKDGAGVVMGGVASGIANSAGSSLGAISPMATMAQTLLANQGISSASLGGVGNQAAGAGAAVTGPADFLRGLGGFFGGGSAGGAPPTGGKSSDWQSMTLDQKREWASKNGASPQLAQTGTDDELNWYRETKQPVAAHYAEQALPNRQGGMFSGGAFGRIQEGIRAMTGVDTRTTAWDEMDVATKRKTLFNIYKRAGAGDDDFAAIAELDEARLDANMGRISRQERNARANGRTVSGGSGQEILDLVKPKESKSPFATSMDPLGSLGSILGNVTSAITGAATLGINALADPAKVEEEMGGRGRVSFQGLQDLQKNLQMSIADDEAKKDKLKLELARKQLDEQGKTAERLQQMPSKLATEFQKLIGLQ